MPTFNRKDTSFNKADGFINIGFIPKSRLADTSLTEEELVSGPTLTLSQGAPVFLARKSDAKIYEAIIEKQYRAIMDYLNENDANTVNDPECPKLTIYKEVAIRLYSEELHAEVFGSASDSLDEEY